MTVQHPRGSNFPTMDFGAEGFHYCSVFKKKEGIYSGRIKLLVGEYVLIKKCKCAIYGKFRFDGAVKITLRDGTVFNGLLTADRKAFGTFCTVITSTSTYVGGMSAGLRHGQGVQRFDNGDICEGRFERGSLVQGSRKRPGRSEYTGSFRNWACHGQGTMTFLNHQWLKSFTGEWRDGLRIRGTVTYVEGHELKEYIGNFSGETAVSPQQEIWTGTLIYSDGRKETFVDGVSQGIDQPEAKVLAEQPQRPQQKNPQPQPKADKAPTPEKENEQQTTTQIFEPPVEKKTPTEETSITEEILQIGTASFKGPIRNGKPHGTGILTFEDGTSTQAEFNDGIGQIKGHTFRDGRIYTGGWSDGHFKGKGFLQFPHGHEFKAYRGIFANGKFEDAKAILTISDSERYVGSFSQNLRHGSGVLFSAEGRKPQEWDKGDLKTSSL